MKKKAKFTWKYAKDIKWTLCPNCGETIYGVTTMDLILPAPKVVNPPKGKKK